MGFTFDDTDKTGNANPLSLKDELIESDGNNAECVFPFIGGEEVNTSATHSAHRFTINFGSMELEQAEQWPQLLEIVRRKVKPDRDKLGNSSIDKAHKRNWWRFANDRPELMVAKRGLKKVLVCGLISNKLSFV